MNNNIKTIKDFLNNLYGDNLNIGYSCNQLYEKFREENQFYVLFTYTHPRHSFKRYIERLTEEGYLNMVKLYINSNKTLNIFYKNRH